MTPYLINLFIFFFLDTSYEKACRRGSEPNTPIFGQKQETQSSSIFSNLFSKR